MAKRYDFDTNGPAPKWPPLMKQFSSNPVAALAAILAREGSGFYHAPSEVVAAAETIIDAAAKLCEPRRSKQSAGAYLERARKAAKPYGIEVVTAGELPDCVLALRLCKSRYGRQGSIFVIA